MEKTEGSKVLIDEFEVRRNRSVTFYKSMKVGELVTYEVSTDGLRFVSTYKSIYEQADKLRNDFKIGDYNK
jgi:hypothetical protein